MQEIGSEFHLTHDFFEDTITNNNNSYFKYGKDQSFFISGRAAIDHILKDILANCNNEIECAYLPIYCCDSMIQPFHNNHIKVEFYDVKILNGRLNITVPKELDNCILLGMSYFGFSNLNMNKYYKDIKKRYKTVIIEDTTHRLLLKENYSANIDYAVASLRKWFPIPSGGMAIKIDDCFYKNKNTVEGDYFVRQKIEAMSLKKDYLEVESNRNLKKEFLLKYKIFNDSLQNSFSNIAIDSYSKKYIFNIDLDLIRRRRIENANYLRNELKHVEQISFLTYASEDVPLFFPVIIDKPEELQTFLASKKIFCPRHWPKPEIVKKSKMQDNLLYEKELSIICDQRYDLKDMSYIIDSIKDYYS